MAHFPKLGAWKGPKNFGGGPQGAAHFVAPTFRATTALPVFAAPPPEKFFFYRTLHEQTRQNFSAKNSSSPFISGPVLSGSGDLKVASIEESAAITGTNLTVLTPKIDVAGAPARLVDPETGQDLSFPMAVSISSIVPPISPIVPSIFSIVPPISSIVPPISSIVPPISPIVPPIIPSKSDFSTLVCAVGDQLQAMGSSWRNAKSTGTHVDVDTQVEPGDVVEQSWSWCPWIAGEMTRELNYPVDVTAGATIRATVADVIDPKYLSLVHMNIYSKKDSLLIFVSFFRNKKIHQHESNTRRIGWIIPMESKQKHPKKFIKFFWIF